MIVAGIILAAIVVLFGLAGLLYVLVALERMVDDCESIIKEDT